jgi:hypothetical protein
VADLAPVNLYFTMEIWQHDDQTLGFRLRNVNEGDDLDLPSVCRAVREISQELNSRMEESPVAVAVMIHANGHSYLEYQTDRNFSERLNYVLTREHFNRVLRTLFTRERSTDVHRRLRIIWNIEWFLRVLKNGYRGLQNALPGAGTTPPPPHTNGLKQPSKGSGEAHEQGRNNVVQLYPKNKGDSC